MNTINLGPKPKPRPAIIGPVDYSKMDRVDIHRHQNGLIKSLNEVLPNGKQGNVEVNSFTVKEEEVKTLKMRSMMSFSYQEYYDFEAGTYKRLIVDNEVMMSTTPMEIRSNREVMTKANGHVLIAGLGLGMIVLPIQDKLNVKSITIIEMNKNVIDLVGKTLPLNDKVKIIPGNIFDFILEKGMKYDTVYFDIWESTCPDNWEEMKTLTKKFKYNINRENAEFFMSSWKKEEVKALAQEERQSERVYNMFNSNRLDIQETRLKLGGL